MANGKSIAVTNKDRPGNRKRVSAQAAAMPKTTFKATETGATMIVR